MIRRWSPPISIRDVVVGARLFWGLQWYLRHPITLEQARSVLRQRLEQREARFLDLVRRAVYGQVDIPYRRLLELAGCEYGDLEKLVSQEGVDEALLVLFRRGVYLTIEEFKGRRPAVRGSARVAVDPGRLRNTYSVLRLPRLTSGSRGSRTAANSDLAAMRESVVNLALSVHAQGGDRWVHAVWETMGGAAITHVLFFSALGSPPVRWFSQIDPATPGLHPRYLWSARMVVGTGALVGVPLPRPEYVPLDDPLPIVHWMASVLRDGRIPHLKTFASSAVRLCHAALGAGVDIRGARFTVTGEPTTEARLASIRRAGADAVPAYGSAEGGRHAYGCLAPREPDDVHLYHDVKAVIQPGPDTRQTDLPPTALLFTELRPTGAFILLNCSLGDQGVMTKEACGCPLEALGWTTHLHTIRSFEKLTAGGMTFLDVDVIRALEDVLPGRFGGGPTDYQLLEEEAEDGRPRLRLLAHPRLGPLDSAQLADTFLSAIGGGSGAERVMELQWRQGDLLQVERRPPAVTATGKILHLHQQGADRA